MGLTWVESPATTCSLLRIVAQWACRNAAVAFEYRAFLVRQWAA